MPTDALRRDLVIANRILAQQGVLDSYGHISVRDPDAAGHFWLAASVSPAQVRVGDLLRFDADARPVPASERALYSERFIHSEIYRARPDVRAVVHGHADEVLPFTVGAAKLRPVLHVAGIIGAELPLWDMADRFGDTDLLVSRTEHGADLAQCLGQSRVVLMRGHGFTVAAQSLELAVRTAVYLKVNARVLSDALRLGPVHYLSDGEIAAIDARMGGASATRRVWDNWTSEAGVGADAFHAPGELA